MTDEKPRVFAQIDDWEDVEKCPVCGGTNHEHLVASIPTNRPILKWRVCPTCGHVFASPRPTQSWLTNYYEEQYRVDTHGELENPKEIPANSGQEEITRALRLMNILMRFRGDIGNVSSHLDIGSSTGAFLAGMMDRFNVKSSVGVEPNDNWRNFSLASFKRFKADALKNKKHALKVYTDLSEVPKSPKFEIVTCIHVLEHMLDPLAALKKVYTSHLMQKGLCLIEVPYMFGGMADPLMFPHLHVFTEWTLAEITRRAGFNVVAIEKFGSGPPFFPAPQHMTIIVQKGPVEPTQKEILRLYNNQRNHVQYVKNQMMKQHPVYQMG